MVVRSTLRCNLVSNKSAQWLKEESECGKWLTNCKRKDLGGLPEEKGWGGSCGNGTRMLLWKVCRSLSRVSDHSLEFLAVSWPWVDVQPSQLPLSGSFQNLNSLLRAPRARSYLLLFRLNSLSSSLTISAYVALPCSTGRQLWVYSVLKQLDHVDAALNQQNTSYLCYTKAAILMLSPLWCLTKAIWALYASCKRRKFKWFDVELSVDAELDFSIWVEARYKASKANYTGVANTGLCWVLEVCALRCQLLRRCTYLTTSRPETLFGDCIGKC